MKTSFPDNKALFLTKNNDVLFKIHLEFFLTVKEG